MLPLGSFRGLLWILLFARSVVPAAMWAQDDPALREDAATAVAIEATPAWVRLHPDDDFATAEPSEDLKKALDGTWHLLIETQEDYRSKTLYYHYARKFLNDEAVAENSDLTFTYDPAYERLVFHKLQIYRDGQIIDRLKGPALRGGAL